MDPEFYRQRASHFQASANQLEKSIRRLAWSRLVVTIITLLLVYLGFKDQVYFYPLPVLIVFFLFLVQTQSKKEAECKILLHLVTLNQQEQEATHFNFKNFPDGARFVDAHHYFSHDLDIFGQGSLFQYLNRCATKLGEERLAKDLTDLRFKKEAVVHRQEAVRELGPLIEFRQQCWAIGKEINDAEFNMDALWSWLNQPSRFHGKKVFMVLRWALPVITCGALVGFVFDASIWPVFVFLFLAQLSIAGAYNKPISKIQRDLSSYRVILENYSKIFNLMNVPLFTSSVMIAHQRIAIEATAHVKMISSLINAIESRMNLFARLFGNGLFLYDFHSVSNLERWREQHASSLPGWLGSLAEWDALLSLATFHGNHPHFAFAEIAEQFMIKGKEVGHPLIPAAERVNNDFRLGDPAQLMLITGANMAGKSTFLRAIGVNYVLASNGAPVCASHWSSPLAELRTGMRTTDSLQDHQSYFFAELNRLKSIMEDLHAGKPIVILLDEILKGTNSTDKQTGSRALITQLIRQKSLVMIATHDIALGDIAQQDPDHIVNTCFEGDIQNGQLHFDYKLKRGLAQKANATFLMKKMGIIP